MKYVTILVMYNAILRKSANRALATPKYIICMPDVKSLKQNESFYTNG